ncbi:DJ-1/PfpI family protein [Jatrophihabitans cynanchi]|jgi:protease I|uniref:DJ-1/PfpI family protein n=1 Tax=Jatrophihabitans cynanchi TaxID=2944128 RepID=A0ABY7K624_9ACTN|nr:DJ-1/PfpI family protein [Jatrophihabitans sp. SB3-54]WAX58967.1 DJ-1/PfpI family protein [Jatrophihabitans sp. SB3-54]
MSRRVVVLGFEGYQELHVWYPVLRLREEGDEVVLAGPDGVSAAFGALSYPLAPQAGVSDIDASTVDLLVVAGGPGAAAAAGLDSLTKFVAQVGAAGGRVVAIAEGAGVLDAAGLSVPSASDAVTVDGNVVIAKDADALPELFRALTNQSS